MCFMSYDYNYVVSKIIHFMRGKYIVELSVSIKVEL